MVRISLYRIKPILILVQAVAIASERRTLLLPYLRSSAFSVFFRIPRACSHFTRTNVRRPLFFFEVIHNGVGFRVPRTLPLLGTIYVNRSPAGYTEQATIAPDWCQTSCSTTDKKGIEACVAVVDIQALSALETVYDEIGQGRGEYVVRGLKAPRGNESRQQARGGDVSGEREDYKDEGVETLADAG